MLVKQSIFDYLVMRQVKDEVEMSLDNTEYGIGVLSSGTIEVMDMLAVPGEYNLLQNLSKSI